MGLRGVIVACALCVASFASQVKADFTYSDFSDVTDLTLQDAATTVGSRLRLNHSAQNVYGSAWYSQKQDISQGFESSFRFQISHMDTPPADGVWFILRDETPLAENLWTTRSVWVEFDTHYNSEKNDPNGTHTGIFTLNELAAVHNHIHCLKSTTNVPLLTDGEVHTVKIRYWEEELSVFIDDMSAARLTLELDLAGMGKFSDGKAYVGLAGITGGHFETHEILDWSFVELRGSDIPEPATLALLLGGAAALLRRRQAGRLF